MTMELIACHYSHRAKRAISNKNNSDITLQGGEAGRETKKQRCVIACPGKFPSYLVKSGNYHVVWVNTFSSAS